jgi:hypothetical protein
MGCEVGSEVGEVSPGPLVGRGDGRGGTGYRRRRRRRNFGF